MDEAELQATRQQIAAALNEIVAAEQQEKDTIEAEYAKQGVIGQWWEEEKAKARGMGKAVVGLLSFAKEVGDLAPLNQFMNAHKVAWDSWRNTDDRPYLQRFTDNLTDSQFKEVADVLGFDPRSITKEGMAEAWAMANFVWNDPETQKLLVQFGADYVSAQHKLELLEFGASAATEIAIDVLITAATAGLGLAVAAGTKLHYLDKFKKLGPLFKKLAELRKKAFQRKQKAGQTGGEIPEKLDKPGVVEPQVKNSDSTPLRFITGDIESAPKYVQLTSNFKNKPASEIKQFYADLEKQGIDYKDLVQNAMNKYGLSPDEAHAVFGYTTKLFYRDLNQTLDAVWIS